MKKVIHLPLAIATFIFLPYQIIAQSMERKSPPNITASYQVLINAPIDTVWKALALDYGGIGKWASGVNHVIESNGQGLNAERSCEINAVGFNDTKERIVQFDGENYFFEYDLYEGLPSFVKYSFNSEKLERRGNQTLWISDNKMRVDGFLGMTTKRVMRKNLVSVLETKAQELKYYIETGRPHLIKLNAKAKKENKKIFLLEQVIDAPVENVWKVIAQDFARVSNSHPVLPMSDFLEENKKIEVGSRRIMYMSKNKRKYFKDEITKLDDAKKEISIRAYEAKGYPINYAELDFFTDRYEEEKTKLTLVFSYKTKPKFLGRMAKRNLKKKLQEYLYAIDYHVETNEVINSDNWNIIKENYD